jgi:hypothetical protein
MGPPDSSHLGWQIVYLAALAMPIAAVSWTVTHEEVFREMRDYCSHRSKSCRSLVQRKFFYLFTCEYCFSHYVALFFMLVTGFRFLVDWWMGYVIALFSLVAVANIYMNLFARLRVDIRAERAEADVKEKEVEVKEKELEEKGGGR